MTRHAADLLRRALLFLDSHPSRKLNNRELALLINDVSFHLLQQRDTPPPVFELGVPMRVNGEAIAGRSKGLVVAWLVLAARQYGIEPLHIHPWFPSGEAARGALVYAARQVERTDRQLAGIVGSIGADRGMLVAKSRGIVQCVSPMLERCLSFV